jgi:outer membrane biosynthesis protein TonB
MSRLSTIARTTATLAVCACATGTASTTPSAATIALYDVNAYRPSPVEATTASRNSGVASSGVTPIGDFVRSRNPQLQFCYEETRAKNPGLAGSATIGVLLAPDGTVTRVDVLRRSWEGSGADQVEGCVLAKVRSWKFPAVDAGAATRPYSFSTVFTR